MNRIQINLYVGKYLLIFDISLMWRQVVDIV